MIVTGPPVDLHEDQLISGWLDARFHHAIGATVFLEQTRAINAKWHLLRLYDSKAPDALLGVAVALTGGTCFWLPEDASAAGALFPAILDLRPCRIVTSSMGRDLLRSKVVPRAHFVREYDQWVMVSARRFPQASGRMAIASDIARLVEYQHQYNEERSVDDAPNWETLVAQEKVAVVDTDGQIVSVVRFGIETDRMVSIGGTYTFPAYRRRGFAERVLEFAVDRIVTAGRTAHLIVDIDNEPAVALYRRMGFECVGSSYVGYLEYQ
ncbi:GNAT family N-acetyltransferase [Aquirhabdus parva]|uniref:GNAT family N-acetyltransferase n=1 Tax=Aquirhabdus parva TaxID=2283318 RepID=A0A345PBR7_9GAMM|nr:GNAT family N-acetyltransferase [Aquirhabdus parva]AXI04726.1 GNAT family N-acetyltransferase [Aquirhabdus parva]